MFMAFHLAGKRKPAAVATALGVLVLGLAVGYAMS